MKRLSKLRLPLIQGGMGVGISMGNLAGAVAKEGAMGVISTANIGFREPDFWENPNEADERALVGEIKKAKKLAEGNGMVAINAMVATTNFAKMIKAACENGIDAIISGAGLPLELPKLVSGYDVLIAPIVSSGRAAKMIIKMWKSRYDREPDFLIVEGSQAGGHLGFSEGQLIEQTAKPIGDLVEEVVSEAGEIPVFAAGSVFDAEDIKAVLKKGASGVQIATRFIATEECDAEYGFKKIITEAKDEDVTILKSPVGMPGRGLNSPLIQAVSKGVTFHPKSCIGCIHGCDPKETVYCINRALIAAFYGDYENGLFFCGGNVGRVSEITSVKKLIEELKKGFM